MPKNKCALCRFCLYDRESNNYACHNEESSNFGTILSTDSMQIIGIVHNTAYYYCLF